MNIRQQRIEVLDDVLAEIMGDKSKCPEGVGVTTNEYVIGQLMELRELIERRR